MVSGFEHYGFFADEESGFVLQGIVYLLSFGFGFGTSADNDELILLILSNGGYVLLGIHYPNYLTPATRDIFLF